MAYFIDLFSPETYQAFRQSSQTVSGFRERQRGIAGRINSGDIFVCYMTQLCRWFGLLEVVSGPYVDNKPIFVPDEDPFVVRFTVRPLVVLEPGKSIPIHDEEIWSGLSFTHQLSPGSLAWTGKVRSSLAHLEEADGQFLADKIRAQSDGGRVYPIDDSDARKLAAHTVRRADKVVSVSVPDDPTAAEVTEAAPEAEARESIRVQALIADIGTEMGLQIWLPRSDRERVRREMTAERPGVLERLPLNYDEATLRTIEQIDVLWLKGRSIVRAFEVEHTTSVYSGILRMADLLALQPNMNIKLHIVAPLSRYDRVRNEIRRPVFSLLERGPLAESCTYISCDRLRELASQKHLEHMSDKVLDEYAEEVE